MNIKSVFPVINYSIIYNNNNTRDRRRTYSWANELDVQHSLTRAESLSKTKAQGKLVSNQAQYNKLWILNENGREIGEQLS